MTPRALTLLLLAAAPAAALSPPPAADDPVLAGLIEESIAARPELKGARERARAERERIPQASTLPDPVLTLGLQNDGFGELMIGKMESSYYQVMLSQGIPWPGKLGLRSDAARLAAEQADAATQRALLGTEADVRRGYLALLVIRDRQALLGQLEAIWKDSAAVARARYESGEGAQSDVLRAQLELNRLKQRRWALQSDERTTLGALNRIRGRPLDEPIPTSASVRDLPLPALREPEAAVAEALAGSPELRQARLDAALAENGVAQARRGLIPDVTLSAAIMPRGSLDPMWQAGVSFNLPVWAWRKQSRAVEENRARAAAGAFGATAIEAQLRQSVLERRTALEALLETVKLYRDGLLVQSQATAESTLAQYRVGRVTFASVLDANAGYVADQEGLLFALADAIGLGISDREVSLTTGGSLAGAGASGTSVPGAGAVASGTGGARGAAGSAPAAAGGGAGGSGGSMGGGM
jgi:outer membrane protein TolC